MIGNTRRPRPSRNVSEPRPLHLGSSDDTIIPRPMGPTAIVPRPMGPTNQASVPRPNVVAPRPSDGARGGVGVTVGPPKYTPPTPATTAPPTTAAPVAPTPPNRNLVDPQRPGANPQINALLQALMADKGADANSIARNAELQKLIEKLMRGEGIATPDLSNDPAARAYAIAKQREAERMRESAAAQIGASGVSGDSELASRAAQIREATGESIAANNADLTNKRRTEALTTAITGANLSMTDLQRQDQARRAASGDRLALLQVIMAGDKTKQDAYEREKDRVAAERARDIEFKRKQEELRYQEQRERYREQELENKTKAEERKKFEDAWRAKFGTPPPAASGQPSSQPFGFTGGPRW